MESNNTRLEAGIDWLTMTYRTQAHDYQQWLQDCLSALQLLIDEGNSPRPGATLGYKGTQAGSLYLGERQVDGMCRISSSWAGKMFPRVMRDGAGVSRLDLQVTVWNPPDGKDTGSNAYDAACKHNDTLADANKRAIRFQTDYAGGYTCYIGARGSEHFARIYDKGRESNEAEYAGAWRFEVELHDKPAKLAAYYLYSKKHGLAEIIVRTLVRYFAERGVRVPFSAKEGATATISSTSPKSDADKKIAWLREQVAPTVRKLREMGLEAAAIDALGLLPATTHAHGGIEIPSPNAVAIWNEIKRIGE